MAFTESISLKSKISYSGCKFPGSANSPGNGERWPGRIQPMAREQLSAITAQDEVTAESRDKPFSLQDEKLLPWASASLQQRTGTARNLDYLPVSCLSTSGLHKSFIQVVNFVL